LLACPYPVLLKKSRSLILPKYGILLACLSAPALFIFRLFTLLLHFFFYILNQQMKLDILAFGAHPDDVELSCAGTLIVEKLQGKKVGVIDLTRGELGTRGSAELRAKEAAAAAAILQLDVRENLALPDGFFRNDEAHQLPVIQAIRKYQPEIIICNAPEDRHPDHGRAAQLLEDAVFLAGLRKIETMEDGRLQEIWRPSYVFNYVQDRYLHPNFVIDISDVMEQKIASIQAYGTQFVNPDLDEPQTYISTPDFLDSVIYRAKMYGKMIGVKYAEGYISKKMIGFNNFNAFIKVNT
jgi:bacillithiol biosynthesis deacetylase BshB1